MSDNQGGNGEGTQYGEQIHAFIEADNGAIICPVCDLEMAVCPTAPILFCGSGRLGDGHWISYYEVRRAD